MSEPISRDHPKRPGCFRITFGKKYMGKQLRDLSKAEVFEYIKWLEDSAEKKMIVLDELVIELRYEATQFFGPEEKVEDDVPL